MRQFSESSMLDPQQYEPVVCQAPHRVVDGHLQSALATVWYQMVASTSNDRWYTVGNDITTQPMFIERHPQYGWPYVRLGVVSEGIKYYYRQTLTFSSNAANADPFLLEQVSSDDAGLAGCLRYSFEYRETNQGSWDLGIQQRSSLYCSLEIEGQDTTTTVPTTTTTVPTTTVPTTILPEQDIDCPARHSIVWSWQHSEADWPETTPMPTTSLSATSTSEDYYYREGYEEPPPDEFPTIPPQFSAWTLAAAPTGDVYTAGTRFVFSQFGPDADGWVVKRNGNNGSIAWTRAITGGNNVLLSAIATDAQANVYVAGTANGAVLGRRFSHGHVVVKLSPDSSVVWVQLLPSGEHMDDPQMVYHDGFVYLAGGRMSDFSELMEGVLFKINATSGDVAWTHTVREIA